MLSHQGTSQLSGSPENITTLEGCLQLWNDLERHKSVKKKLVQNMKDICLQCEARTRQQNPPPVQWRLGRGMCGQPLSVPL